LQVGADGKPLTSTMPMEALQLGKRSIKNQAATLQQTESVEKRPMPAQKATAQRISSPLGSDERWSIATRITVGIRGGWAHTFPWSP
jgi:hypothetical protein